MQTYHNIWMHFVWATKKRARIISKDLMERLFPHFKKYGSENNIYVDAVSGDMEHVHLLIGSMPTQAPSEIANLLKGESSHWINRSEIIRGKFAWQRGFSVFSVSQSQIGKVRRYIRNQEEHHRTATFKEELDGLLKLHGLPVRPDSGRGS